jgi:Mg-chelatase subunit ChlD
MERKIMPNNDLTEIVCIVDKSGSMETIKTDAIGGFNQFLKEQKEIPSPASMTIVLFDTAYKFLVEGKDIQAVETLNEHTYTPGGCTALLDAVGITIDKVVERLSGIPDDQQPGKVLVAILTDGEENSSKEYNRQQIFDRIKKQTDAGWRFLFLAANQDAFAEAGSLGIAMDSTANFAATPDGIKHAFVGASFASTCYRAGQESELKVES